MKRDPCRASNQTLAIVTATATERICRECGVQLVTAHSMRGLHATLAKRSGATSAAVAAQLGHSDERVSEQSYIAPDAKAGADQDRVLHVLSGGRK